MSESGFEGPQKDFDAKIDEFVHGISGDDWRGLIRAGKPLMQEAVRSGNPEHVTAITSRLRYTKSVIENSGHRDDTMIAEIDDILDLAK